MKLTSSRIYCVLLIFAGLSGSCKKITDAEKNNNSTESLSGISPVPSYTWTKLDIPGPQTSYPFNRPWSQDIVAPVGDTYYLWTGTYKEKVFRFNKTTLRWEAQPVQTPADLLLQNKVLFKYQSKVYYAFRNSFDTKFGALDPATGTITQLAPFPAPDSVGYYPQTFVIGDNGYLSFTFNHGYWKYNFPTNTWTQLGENPFRTRRDPTIVVAGNKVYAGLGWNAETINGSTYPHYHRDWIEFHPDSPGTVAKTDFPGFVTSHTKTCVIGDKIYLGFGKRVTGGSGYIWDYNLFKYDISANNWVECAEWPGAQITPYNGDYSQTTVNILSIGSSVYAVSGGIYESWRYGNTPIITGTN